MPKIGRRKLFRVALGAGAIVSIPAVVTSASWRTTTDELADEYVNPISTLARLDHMNQIVRQLSAGDYLRFYRKVCEKVAAMSQDRDAVSQKDASVTLRERAMEQALRIYGRPVHQLSVAEEDAIMHDLQSRLGKGGGRSRPAQQLPCFTYTHAAFLQSVPLPPNYSTYYGAAGSPNCTDLDLEILYSSSKNKLHPWVPAGAAYISYLLALGRIAPLRNTGGNTGMLVGGGDINLFFAGSTWYAAYSLSLR